jgi:hypothetical protein
MATAYEKIHVNGARIARLRSAAKSAASPRAQFLCESRLRAAVLSMKLESTILAPNADKPEAQEAAMAVGAALEDIETALASGDLARATEWLPTLERNLLTYAERSGLKPDDVAPLSQDLRKTIEEDDADGAREVCAAIRAALALPASPVPPERPPVEELRQRMQTGETMAERRRAAMALQDLVTMRAAMSHTDADNVARLSLDPRDLAINGRCLMHATTPRGRIAFGRPSRIV